MPSVIKRIQEYNKDISGELLQMKMEALLESPFRFYRGTCHLFAEDFQKAYSAKAKVTTWICADLHFENFGSYKGQNRLVYFDINDFDESFLGIPEVDLARFLTSIIIAGRQMRAKAKDIHDTLIMLADAYVANLHAGKALMMEHEVAHDKLKKYFDELLSRDRDAFIAKRTEKKKTGLVIKTDGVMSKPITASRKKQVFAALNRLLKSNKHFADLELKDAAFRIAGTGSLGLQRYEVLCYSKKRGKYYFLDIKEARRSCYTHITKIKQPRFANEAERTLYAGWVMQFCTPGYMQTLEIDNKWYVVKELQPTIDKMAIEGFGNDFKSLRESALEMAPLIAYAHIRSSGHKGASTADGLIKFSEKHKWKNDIIELSGDMADKNDKYYHTYLSSKHK